MQCIQALIEPPSCVYVLVRIYWSLIFSVSCAMHVRCILMCFRMAQYSARKSMRIHLLNKSCIPFEYLPTCIVEWFKTEEIPLWSSNSEVRNSFIIQQYHVLTTNILGCYLTASFYKWVLLIDHWLVTINIDLLKGI